jgi:hypothetical protein
MMHPSPYETPSDIGDDTDERTWPTITAWICVAVSSVCLLAVILILVVGPQLPPDIDLPIDRPGVYAVTVILPQFVGVNGGLALAFRRNLNVAVAGTLSMLVPAYGAAFGLLIPFAVVHLMLLLTSRFRSSFAT